MALPLVETIVDCADWSKTVAPFVSQLKTLPGQLAASITDPAALKQLYLDTNPLVSALAFALATAPIFFVVSEITRNYSQVDRVWSILPSIFNAHYCVYAHLLGLETRRIDALLAASCLWSARLTYNYWRRGGYQVGSEDYRWKIVRNDTGSAGFLLLNVFFIATLQPVLLFLITTPTYVLLLTLRLASSAEYGENVPTWLTADLIFSRALLAFVLLAYYADQQQWQYHQAKQYYQKTAKVPPKYKREDLERGFNTSGLWAWSRHPNFFAEQAFWLTIYQWDCRVTRTIFNWTGVGALSYLLLFQASTLLTERITAGKYPEYADYQRKVGKFIPGLGKSYKRPLTKDATTDGTVKVDTRSQRNKRKNV